MQKGTNYQNNDYICAKKLKIIYKNDKEPNIRLWKSPC